jgi:hypothetical protein
VEGIKTLFFRDEKLERIGIYSQRVLSGFTRDGLMPGQEIFKNPNLQLIINSRQQ